MKSDMVRTIKWPDKLPDAEVFLAELSYELIPSAIIADVDIILTGDKDFLSFKMDHPKCMNIAMFIEYVGLEL